MNLKASKIFTPNFYYYLLLFTIIFTVYTLSNPRIIQIGDFSTMKYNFTLINFYESIYMTFVFVFVHELIHLMLGKEYNKYVLFISLLFAGLVGYFGVRKLLFANNNQIIYKIASLLSQASGVSFEASLKSKNDINASAYEELFYTLNFMIRYMLNESN